MNRFSIFLISIIFILLAFNAQSQLSLKGEVFSSGPVEITYQHLSDGNTYTLPVSSSKIKKDDAVKYVHSRFRMPYGFEKNYDYAMRFTDGTVDKTLIIYGPVPEGFWPKQKFDLTINLQDISEADDTWVIYWSVIHDEYVLRPFSELEQINSEVHKPLNTLNTEEKTFLNEI